jgi:hypothetical protein
MKAIGLILVLLGIVGLVYGGINYDRKKTVVDIGPIEATATERESIPIPPIAGGIAIVAGLALLIAPTRRAAA